MLTDLKKAVDQKLRKQVMPLALCLLPPSSSAVFPFTRTHILTCTTLSLVFPARLAPSHAPQVLDILGKLHSHTPSPRILNTTKIHIYIQSKLACMEGDRT